MKALDRFSVNVTEKKVRTLIILYASETRRINDNGIKKKNQVQINNFVKSGLEIAGKHDENDRLKIGRVEIREKGYEVGSVNGTGHVSDNCGRPSDENWDRADDT